jgi:hypothetical protein
MRRAAWHGLGRGVTKACATLQKADWKAKGLKFDPARDPKTVCVREVPLTYTKDQIHALFAKVHP